MFNYKNNLLIALVILLLTGCSTFSTAAKTPLEWVTLANSGLSGRDNYNYSAQVETGINNDIKMSMNSFSGEVHSHQEYTLHSAELDSTFLHPTKYMDIINKQGNNVSYLQEGIDPHAQKLLIKVLVEESEEEATQRWKGLLEQQFTQAKLSFNLDMQNSIQQQYIDQYIKEAEQELKDMLSTLQVKSNYVLSIDSKHAMPVYLEEHVDLYYLRSGKQHQEYRHSNIEFQYE